MRYGHQPYSEIMRMPFGAMLNMVREIDTLILRENESAHPENGASG